MVSLLCYKVLCLCKLLVFKHFNFQGSIYKTKKFLILSHCENARCIIRRTITDVTQTCLSKLMFNSVCIETQDDLFLIV